MTITNSTLQRLDQLEGFLRDDPHNAALLTDAFEVALQAGAWARAETHLRQGLTVSAAVPWPWRLRESQWLMAQGRRDEARALLISLQDHPAAPEALRPVVAHDLALIALRDGTPEPGLLVLAPWVGNDPQRPVDAPLQMMWLRLMHHAGRMADAMAWSQARWQAGQLAAPAAGIAALIAVDVTDLPAALQWAEHALKVHGGPGEAMVARASVGLTRGEAALARALLERALQSNPMDGRVVSALGFADLLERRLDAARATLSRAVQLIPAHVGTWHALGWTCLLQNDLEAAKAAFERAIELDRNFGESHGGLAVVLAVRNERDAAADAIRRAAGLDRNNLSGRYAQALLDGEASDIRSLQPLAQRLLGDRPAPFGGSLLDLLPPLVGSVAGSGGAGGASDGTPPEGLH
ncbi:TPR repeat-containing protein [Roseateles sp. YR242]|uniref:tetratricopeptide repeat protein n=1 Tax=Roseateles sp. YR242 TaxID=1855305 RepID=UPI0008C29487|nr:tetratricopeptide repeat protein [Roseateles sp. YR242]SEK92771.1 TPR repeat-containing protein [Roseateles sp. YR242]